MKRGLESSPSAPEQAQSDLHVATEAFDFSGPWFDSRTAAAYVRCPSVGAFYQWRKRHGIVGNGRRVAKADLDRALRGRGQRRRQMSPASLANLRRA